jgi:hypothetical protein
VSRILRLRTRLRPCDSPSEIYAAMAAIVPADVLLVFGAGIVRELRQELRSIDAVGAWAVDLATRLRRPVMLNMPDRDGGSHTLTLSPPGWSQERLSGYIAGRHQELEEAFGPIERIRGAA